MKEQIRNAFLLAVTSILCILFSQNGYSKTEKIYLYDVFDTYSEISATGAKCEKALGECRELLLRYHDLWNDKSETSEISELNRSAGISKVTLSEETADILNKSKFFCAETNGFFDVTIGAAAKLWNIPKNPKIPSKEELTDVIHKTGTDILELDGENAYLTKEGASVTLGAIAKGYAAEKLVNVMKKNKIRSALINLGGNVYALGSDTSGKAWKIGIADPQNDGETIGTVEVCNKSVITSGGNYRFFEEDGIRYCHILNPYTASPANSGILSVTVICSDPTAADVLSTACFVIGYANSLPLLKEYEAEAVFVTDTKTVYYTDGLENIFEYDGNAYEYKCVKI